MSEPSGLPPIKSMGENELLTVREAARRLKIHPATLRRYVREGLVQAYTVRAGARISAYRFRSADINKMVERVQIKDEQESMDDMTYVPPKEPLNGVKIVDNSPNSGDNLG